MSNSQHSNRACPSVGLMDDADTSLAFPSVWNCCHRARPIAPPTLRHQNEYCLSINYRQCPVFLRQQTAPLSEHLRPPFSRRSMSRELSRRNTLIALISLGVIFLLGWAIITRTTAQTTMPASTATWVAVITNSPIWTPVKTPASAETATLVPITATHVMPLSKHQLDIPIGVDHKFVLHRVLDGENLNQYAAGYDTSIEAIVMVNYDLKTPVWVGTIVVIPVGFTDVADLPAFEAYEVTQVVGSLSTLAQEFGVDVNDLKYYNAIDAAESLRIGDWLLIPHTRPTP